MTPPNYTMSPAPINADDAHKVTQWCHVTSPPLMLMTCPMIPNIPAQHHPPTCHITTKQCLRLPLCHHCRQHWCCPYWAPPPLHHYQMGMAGGRDGGERWTGGENVRKEREGHNDDNKQVIVPWIFHWQQDGWRSRSQAQQCTPLLSYAVLNNDKGAGWHMPPGSYPLPFPQHHWWRPAWNPYATPFESIGGGLYLQQQYWRGAVCNPHTAPILVHLPLLGGFFIFFCSSLLTGGSINPKCHPFYFIHPPSFFQWGGNI